jgi:hypothetical protein
MEWVVVLAKGLVRESADLMAMGMATLWATVLELE